jgi:hypothetical protein
MEILHLIYTELSDDHITSRYDEESPSAYKLIPTLSRALRNLETVYYYRRARFKLKHIGGFCHSLGDGQRYGRGRWVKDLQIRGVKSTESERDFYQSTHLITNLSSLLPRLYKFRCRIPLVNSLVIVQMKEFRNIQDVHLTIDNGRILALLLEVTSLKRVTIIPDWPASNIAIAPVPNQLRLRLKYLDIQRGSSPPDQHLRNFLRSASATNTHLNYDPQLLVAAVGLLESINVVNLFLTSTVASLGSLDIPLRPATRLFGRATLAPFINLESLTLGGNGNILPEGFFKGLFEAAPKLKSLVIGPYFPLSVDGLSEGLDALVLPSDFRRIELSSTLRFVEAAKVLGMIEKARRRGITVEGKMVRVLEMMGQYGAAKRELEAVKERMRMEVERVEGKVQNALLDLSHLDVDIRSLSTMRW